jgi:hypothetical protein
VVSVSLGSAMLAGLKLNIEQSVIYDPTSINADAVLPVNVFVDVAQKKDMASVNSSYSIVLSTDNTISDYTESNEVHTSIKIGRIESNERMVDGETIYYDLIEARTNVVSSLEMHRVAFSGEYSELENAPDINEISSNVFDEKLPGFVNTTNIDDPSKLATALAVKRAKDEAVQHANTELAKKFDKTGGEISGPFNIRSTAPTINFFDADHRGASIHVNANTFYILRANDTKDGHALLNGAWPLTIGLEGDQDASFAGHIHSHKYGFLHDYFIRDVRLSGQEITGYVNGLDGGMDTALDGGAVMNGMSSYHNQKSEDRRFRFYFRRVQALRNNIWYTVTSV